MMITMIARIFVYIFFSVLISACASSTRIYTKPSGATLITEGDKYLGTSPLQLTEPVWIWSKRTVKASLPGYQSRQIVLKNTGINPGKTIGCLCTAGILLPLFFSSTYLPQYQIELVPNVKKSASITLQKPISFHE